MKKLQLPDVKNLHDYELIRDEWRREVVAAKTRRRVLLGEKISLVFENRLTVLHQVQEMCRAERIAKPELVQHEIDVYNELLPDPGELAATLFVELTEETSIRAELDRLVGLTDGEKLWLEAGGRRFPARFLPGQSREDRIAAVQYLRIPVGGAPGVAKAIEEGPARLVIEHPSYEASAGLSPETRGELARDLTPD